MNNNGSPAIRNMTNITNQEERFYPIYSVKSVECYMMSDRGSLESNMILLENHVAE